MRKKVTEKSDYRPLPRREEVALERIFGLLVAWAVRNDERINRLGCPSEVRKPIDDAHTALSLAVERAVPGCRRWSRGKGE